jgi:hypothetical protein
MGGAGRYNVRLFFHPLHPETMYMTTSHYLTGVAVPTILSMCAGVILYYAFAGF